MAGAAATRDIVFRLKAQADPGAKAAFDAFAKHAKTAQQVIDEAVKQSGQKKAKDVELFAGHTLKVWEQESKKIDNMLKAREMAAKQTAEKIAQANAKMNAGFDKSLEAVIKLGRGLAMSGLIGEENLQKITDGLIKIQAASDIIRGGKDLIGGVSAMSAAGKAAGAAGGGGMMAGAASLAAPAAAAAAALLSVAAASQMVYEAFTGQAQRLDSWSNKIAESEVGWIGWLDSMTGGTKANELLADTFGFLANNSKELNGGLVRASRAARESGEALEKNAAAAAKAKAEREAIDKATANQIRGDAATRAGQQRGQDLRNQFAVERSGTGLTDNDKAGLLNEQARIDAVKEIQAAEAAMADAKRAGLRSEQAAADIHGQAIERAIALQYEALNIAKQEKAERIAGLREALALQTQMADKAMARAKELANANKSDYQKFADLDIEQKKQLVEVRDKLDKGQNLTKEEADLAGGFNEFRDRVNVNRQNVGVAADKPFGLFNEGRDRAARAAAAVEKPQDAKIKLSNDINVVVENKVDENAIVAAMQPLIQAIQQGQKQMEEIVRREVAAGARGGANARGAVLK